MKNVLLGVIIGLCIVGSAFADESIRERAANAYIHGVLSGSGDESYPIWKGGGYRDLPWLISMAYPVTSWSWSRAVIDSVTDQGSDTLVQYRKPDVSSFISYSGKEMPRAVREWFAEEGGEYKVQSLSAGKLELKIGNNGFFPDDAASLLRDAVLRDLHLAVDWCIEHKKYPNRLRQLASQVRYSSVPVVPKELKDKLLNGAITP